MKMMGGQDDQTTGNVGGVPGMVVLEEYYRNPNIVGVGGGNIGTSVPTAETQFSSQILALKEQVNRK